MSIDGIGGGALSPEEGDAVDSIINLPDGDIPQAVDGELVPSGAKFVAGVAPVRDKIVFDEEIEVPANSILLGQVITLSEGTNTLIDVDNVTGGTRASVRAPFDTSGSSRAGYFKLATETNFVVNSDDSQTLATNPFNVQITAVNQAQINVLHFKTGAIMTNVRVRITDNFSGVVLRYLPNKASWDQQVNGFDFVSGDNLIDLLSTALSTPGVINVGVSPLRFNAGQDIDITVEADSVNLLGNISGIPYLNVDEQVGVDTDLIEQESELEDTGVPFVNTAGQLLTDITNLNFDDGTDTLNVQNLHVAGTFTTVDVETLSVTASHVITNAGYETVAPRAGGIAVNYLPTSTNDTVTAGAFVAGVASTSNPTVTTDGSDTFAQNDVIQINGTANSGENDGLFEVEDHTGTTLTIRGIGNDPVVLDFTNNQFIANGSDNATIRKVTVSDLHTDPDGDWSEGHGSDTTQFSYEKILHSNLIIADQITGETLEFTSSGFSGETGIVFNNFSPGSEEFKLVFNDSLNIIEAACNSAIHFNMDNKTFNVLRENSTDDGVVLSFGHTGTNPATIHIHTTDRDPEGNILGHPADMAFRANGVNSEFYVMRSVSDSSTGWTPILASTQVTIDDTDASILITSPSASDLAMLILRNSSTTEKARYEYNETTDTVIISSFTDLDIDAIGKIDMDALGGDITIDTNQAISLGATTDITLQTFGAGDINLTSNQDVVMTGTNLTWNGDPISTHPSGNGNVHTNDTLTANHLVVGNGTEEIKLVANAEFDVDGDRLTVRGSGVSADPGFEIRDNADSTKLQILHDDGSNTNLIISDEFIEYIGLDVQKHKRIGTTGAEGVLELENTGTNGGVFEIFVPSRTPVGFNSGSNGDIAFRADGADSAMYINVGTSSNTVNWAEFAQIVPTGNDNILTIKPVAVAGLATIDFETFAGVPKGTVGYNENLNEFQIASTVNMELSISDGKHFHIERSGGGDNDDVLVIENTGTNAGSIGIYLTDREPIANITSIPGDIVIRENGVNSDIKLNVGSISNNDDYVSLRAASILVFGSSSIGTTTVIRYLGVGGRTTIAGTSPENERLPVPRNGLLKGLTIKQGIVSGNGADVTYTVMVNDIATSIAVTLDADSTTVTSDNSNQAFIDQGDHITIRVTKAGSITGGGPTHIYATLEMQ